MTIRRAAIVAPLRIPVGTLIVRTDLVELNEASAVQVLAVLAGWGRPHP